MQLKINNLLELNFQKKIECSASVAWWNYWDHEHLDVVHDGYKRSDIMYDKNNYLFRIDKIKIPLIPFISIKTPIFMVQHNENTLYTYAIQFGVTSKTTITINPINDQSCEIYMNYKFYLDGWKLLLKPFLKKLIPRWNEKVWIEDYSVKIRRQRVLNMDFKDFIGLPNELKDRVKPFKNYSLKLPIPRPKKSTRDRHPLSNK